MGTCDVAEGNVPLGAAARRGAEACPQVRQPERSESAVWSCTASEGEERRSF
ncbi:MAG: hypothetical protein QCI82_01085 [Candidatus Thermoplasmatota archaeon]|nr:hypothetical protein [Candidatus Thermoplasmatota archaeon]